MKKTLQDLRIIFMGTPDFAVASLQALVDAGCNIAAVVTAPDKPAGRGMKPSQSAVKIYATEKGLPVIQPEKLKDPQFIAQLESLHADVQVVVAFRMLPEIVWSMPPLGTINVHASLLPQYRGAAPINWAVINGEKETGVTTFRLQHAIDTGNILLQEKLTIAPDETAGELYDRLKVTGASILLQTLEGIAAGSLHEKAQSNTGIPEDQLKHAPKIFTETCRISWTEPARAVHNLIRGLAPYPGAFTILQGKTLKIFKARFEIAATSIAPGQWETDRKSWLRFAAADGYVYPEIIQPEGKKRMKTEDFLRGFRVE